MKKNFLVYLDYGCIVGSKNLRYFYSDSKTTSYLYGYFATEQDALNCIKSYCNQYEIALDSTNRVNCSRLRMVNYTTYRNYRNLNFSVYEAITYASFNYPSSIIV